MSSENAPASAPGGFRSAGWLPGPHLQTVWGRLARSRRQVPMRRETLETPDGDDLVVDHVEGPAGTPRVIVLHGLEGSSNSVYAQGLLLEIRRRGWRGAAMNFRSCARDPGDLSRMLPNRRPRLYHSGETEDLDFLARTLAARDPEAPLYAVGVSLGGNVLLKWLGEARSPPPGRRGRRDLDAVRPRRERASPRHGHRAVLHRPLPRDAQDEGRRGALAGFPRRPGRSTCRAPRRPHASGSSTTRPTRRFTALRAWTTTTAARARSRYLPGVRTPALCLSAQDDPFLPAEALERARRAAPPGVEFLVTPGGGHIGFVAGAAPWRPRYWAEELAIDWLGRSR